MTPGKARRSIHSQFLVKKKLFKSNEHNFQNKDSVNKKQLAQKDTEGKYCNNT